MLFKKNGEPTCFQKLPPKKTSFLVNQFSPNSCVKKVPSKEGSWVLPLSYTLMCKNKYFIIYFKKKNVLMLFKLKAFVQILNKTISWSFT